MLKKPVSTLFLVLITLFVSCRKDVSTTPEKPAPIVVSSTPFVLNASVYPNPTTGIFTLQTNDTKPDTVTIVSVIGQTILTQIINGTTVFDIIGLQQGVYFVTVKGEGQHTTRKIIISN